MRRFIPLLAAASLVAAFLSSPPTPRVSAADGWSDDTSKLLNDPALREAVIDADIRFRKGLHFRAGRDYVESLYEHPERTVGTRAPGVLLTPEENAEFKARMALDADSAIIMTAIEASPALRASFGGIALDHETGELAVFLKAGAPTPWISDVPHPGRISIRPAELSETELLAFKSSISSAAEAGEPGTGAITVVALDTMANAVRVYFLPAAVEGLPAGAFPAAFSSRFDTTHLVRGTSPGVEAAGEHPLRAGWSWGHSYGRLTYRCTMGFAVEKEGAPEGWTFAITAGHCVHPGEDGSLAYHNYG
jgi:hypothetical protein